MNIKSLFLAKKFNIFLCFAVYVILFLMQKGVFFVQDKLDFASGTLKTIEYTSIEKLALENIDIEGENRFVTVTWDPVIYLSDLNTRVNNVIVNIRYAQNPVELTAYYRLAGQSDFTVGQRVYGTENSDGSYGFDFGRKNITDIRIDPGIINQNHCQFLYIVINKPNKLSGYFAISLQEVFYFLVVPAIFAVILSYLVELFIYYKPYIIRLYRRKSAK